ncbi:MAG: DUF4296 domain-containing protein [Muribaculaceae bacterium]|nr:DUF4296 domain-containing protein [Muribaculaceae bacterium]
MRKQPAYIAAGIAAVLSSCNGVPDYVIQPDEMALLMADVRMADAVVTIQAREYNNDTIKLALRRAVLERHGVTEACFDTSLVWYGYNIGKYQEVTQMSIDILEQRLKDAAARAAGEAALSVAGDSVDIWTGPTVFYINRRSPSRYIAFVFDTDRNWESGDIYTLRSRVVSPVNAVRWNMTALYDDGAIETATSSMSVSEPGRQELMLVTDSTRTAVRISGWIEVTPEGHRPAVIDSLGLTRRRANAIPAHGRRNMQRLIVPKNKKDNTRDADSVTCP